MLQDFDIERTETECITRTTKKNELQAKYDKVCKDYDDIIIEYDQKNTLLKGMKNKQHTALSVINNSGLFSKFASLFGTGRYFKNRQDIRVQESAIVDLANELNELLERKETLATLKNNLLSQLQQPELNDSCYDQIDGELVIHSGPNVVKTITNDDMEATESDKKVLIHCTTRFPKHNIIQSNYDGNKIVHSAPINHRGISKIVATLSHRHSVHFTQNNVVQNIGTGEGNWDDANIGIVECYDLHEDELCSTLSSDSFTNESVHLSPNAVIFINLKDKDNLPIPENERKNYNIIFYEGSLKSCILTFLSENNYKIFPTNAHCGIHADSFEYKFENLLLARDAAIGYFKDEDYISKELPVFSSEQIISIIDIFRDVPHNKLIPGFHELYKLEKEHVSMDVLHFILSSGIKKLDNGMYTFSTEEEILNYCHYIWDNKDILPDFIDLDLAKDFSERLHQLDELECPPYSAISHMKFVELYKNENKLAAQTFFKSLPSNVTITRRR